MVVMANASGSSQGLCRKSVLGGQLKSAEVVRSGPCVTRVAFCSKTISRTSEAAAAPPSRAPPGRRTLTRKWVGEEAAGDAGTNMAVPVPLGRFGSFCLRLLRLLALLELLVHPVLGRVHHLALKVRPGRLGAGSGSGDGGVGGARPLSRAEPTSAQRDLLSSAPEPGGLRRPVGMDYAVRPPRVVWSLQV